MNRREFIPLLGSAAAWPITARAQVRKAYRIGTLTSSTFESASHVIKAFEESMAELGYVSPSNIIYEHRFGGGRLRAGRKDGRDGGNPPQIVGT
jgi:putative ABC transport system substrate-binding protein